MKLPLFQSPELGIHATIKKLTLSEYVEEVKNNTYKTKREVPLYSISGDFSGNVPHRRVIRQYSPYILFDFDNADISGFKRTVSKEVMPSVVLCYKSFNQKGYHVVVVVEDINNKKEIYQELFDSFNISPQITNLRENLRGRIGKDNNPYYNADAVPYKKKG